MNLYYWFYMSQIKAKLDVQIASMGKTSEEAREKVIKILKSDNVSNLDAILEYIKKEPIIIVDEALVSYGEED